LAPGYRKKQVNNVEKTHGLNLIKKVVFPTSRRWKFIREMSSFLMEELERVLQLEMIEKYEVSIKIEVWCFADSRRRAFEASCVYTDKR